jgi:GNAT superfamily N-acetyltransferase
MQIRDAQIGDAAAACLTVRRSIAELCRDDHRDDAQTVAAWLANKTADNVSRWIGQSHVVVATEGVDIIGVGAITASGEITLNYVSPDARFRGVSKAILAGLEAQAAAQGIETITLHSTATAHRFYRSAGFVDDGPPVKGFGVTFGFPMTKRLR